MGKLEGKVAIITGGGSGIGRAISILFANEGAKVVITDLIKEKGEETMKLIKEKGGEAIFIQADVSKASDVQEVISAAMKKYGRIDILCNNAGIPSFGSVIEMSEEDWDKVINVNLKSVFLCSKYVAPEMLKGGGGTIINIASVLGLIGSQGEAAYCASKGGVISLTRAMALDFAPNIRVNCVCPGSVLTPMYERIISQKKLMPGSFEKIPLKRGAKPEEIAHAVLYLASEDSSYITGSLLVIDGGWTIS